MPPKRKGALDVTCLANGKVPKRASKAKKSNTKKKPEILREAPSEDELEEQTESEEGEESGEESEEGSADDDGEDQPISRVAKQRKIVEEEDAEVRRLEAEAVRLRKQKLALQEEVVQHTAGQMVRIKNHVPFVVTQKDVEDYDGSFESALHAKTVDAEKVCSDTICNLK